MNAGPAVSVVIPTYNRRALLVEAVGTVRSQTQDDFELVIVDDGSTDGTAEALQSLIAGDPRARVIRQSNHGTAMARNRGVAEARAPWVAFLDSDDLWESEYLASQLCALADDPEADLVVGDVAYVNQGRKADSLFADPDFRAPISLDAMCLGGWALPSAIVVRTEIARAIGFTNTYRIIEDTEFLLRCHVDGHRCILNPARLVQWRRPEGEGAPAKTSEAFEIEVEMLELMEAYRHLAPDPEAVARRLYAAHRSVAKSLSRSGQFREARPHLRACMRARPARLGPRLLYLRGLFSIHRS